MKLVAIDKEKYAQYKLDVIFDGYKWDPQFFDTNTVSDHILVLSEKEHKQLKDYVEKLGAETEAAEVFIAHNYQKVKHLKLPYKMKKNLNKLKSYNKKQHVRLMRFDFHPTIDETFALSEVNSDVPGGFAEASLMPEIALKYVNNQNYYSINFKDQLIKSLRKKLKENATLMMVHCTSYSDDRQVMQFLGDQLEKLDYKIIYGAADHIKFFNKKAYSILDNNTGKLDGIIRFNPIEWVVDIKNKHWENYFDTTTLSCNHPIAVLTQSKRFPLIWDTLEENGLDLTMWKKLLPETLDVKSAKNKEGFIYKPVWGRVGENISIKEAISKNEYQKILKDVKRHPKKYIAQKKFISKPLYDTNNMPYHLSLGVYYIEGSFAGYYARVSTSSRVDSFARDIAVVIERE